MSETDRMVDRSADDGFTAYPLLDAIVHVMGNGLAAISGYTQLLQKAISAQAQFTLTPELDGWQRQNERWLAYLQIMHERGALLNDFLNQLRAFSQEATKEHFNKCSTRIDLVLLLRRVVECVAPLHQDRTIQLHLSAQPLYVMCDLFWMELMLEHVIDHTVEAHTRATPIDIGIKCSEDPASMLYEARIEICVHSGPLRPKAGPEEQFEAWWWTLGWWRTLGAKDLEICSMFCRDVLRKHGGRIWIERVADQEEIVSLALPLIKESR